MAIIPPAIILAGGKGTRLQGVVSDRPKPMAQTCGRPFLEWLLIALRQQDIRRVVLATGYMAETVEAYFGSGAAWDLEITYSVETGPLGTGGAIRQAAGLVESEQLLVLNGDSYCRLDWSRLAAMHHDRGAAATMWLVPQPDCKRYGAVAIGEDGCVRAFIEKSGTQGAGLINAGVYLLNRRVVEAIPQGRPAALERDIFPHLVGGGLYGVVGEERFLDIGTPESYAQCHQFIQEETAFWRMMAPANQRVA